MSAPQAPYQDQPLVALPAAEFKRLEAHLEPVWLRRGEMLYQPGSQLQHAFLPTTAIVSLHCVTHTGASAETAGVYHEGVVGISLFVGGDTTPSSAVVQIEGHAYRLERRILHEEFERTGPMQRLLLRYTQALMTQMSLTAACNRHHSVERQLCRWLLLTLRPRLVARDDHDPGTGGQLARRAPGNRSTPARCAIDAARLPSWIGRAWKTVRASAMRW